MNVAVLKQCFLPGLHPSRMWRLPDHQVGRCLTPAEGCLVVRGVRLGVCAVKPGRPGVQFGLWHLPGRSPHFSTSGCPSLVKWGGGEFLGHGAALRINRVQKGLQHKAGRGMWPTKVSCCHCTEALAGLAQEIAGN